MMVVNSPNSKYYETNLPLIIKKAIDQFASPPNISPPLTSIDLKFTPVRLLLLISSRNKAHVASL